MPPVKQTVAHSPKQSVCDQCHDNCPNTQLSGMPTYCLSCSDARASCDLVKSCAHVTVHWKQYGVYHGWVIGAMHEDGRLIHSVYYPYDKDSQWHDLKAHGGVEFLSVTEVSSPKPAIGERVHVSDLWTEGARDKKSDMKRRKRKTTTTKKDAENVVQAIVVKAARINESDREGVLWPGKVIHLLEYKGERHWHCFEKEEDDDDEGDDEGEGDGEGDDEGEGDDDGDDEGD